MRMETVRKCLLMKPREPGEELPWWRGFVMTNHHTWCSWSAPVPLNILLRACYLAWCWVKFPMRGDFREGRVGELIERVRALEGRDEVRWGGFERRLGDLEYRWRERESKHGK